MPALPIYLYFLCTDDTVDDTPSFTLINFCYRTSVHMLKF